MEVFTDGLVAFLAAVGLSSLAWMAAELLCWRESPVRAVIVLPLRGEGEGLDEALMAACAARTRLGRESSVVLLDAGLAESGRQRAAALAEQNRCVTVLLPSQLEKFIT